MRFFGRLFGKRPHTGAAPIRAAGNSEVIAAHVNVVIQKGLPRYAPEIRFRVDGSKIKVGEEELEVLPVIEQRAKQDMAFLCAVRFEVSVASMPQTRFIHDAIGIGDSITDAEQTAVVEWFMAFGLPLFKSFAQSSIALHVNGYKVYPGFMGMRGGPPGDWVDGSVKMHEKVLAALEKVLHKPAVPMSILDLKLMAALGEPLSGECRIDGVVSQVVLQALQELPWPRSPTSYIWKQVYVLRAS